MTNTGGFNTSLLLRLLVFFLFFFSIFFFYYNFSYRPPLSPSLPSSFSYPIRSIVLLSPPTPCAALSFPSILFLISDKTRLYPIRSNQINSDPIRSDLQCCSLLQLTVLTQGDINCRMMHQGMWIYSL